MPNLQEKESLRVNKLAGLQHFTQPPARYTEASLTTAMEENGIGRPSTYAPTITTIISRNYVERDGKQLVPTPLGEITTELIRKHFNQFIDVGFTANMETDLKPGKRIGRNVCAISMPISRKRWKKRRKISVRKRLSCRMR